MYECVRKERITYARRHSLSDDNLDVDIIGRLLALARNVFMRRRLGTSHTISSQGWKVLFNLRNGNSFGRKPA